MRKFIQHIVFVIVVCIPFVMHTQTTVKVILHNGGSLKGELISINDEGDLILQMSGQQPMTIKSHLIKKFTADGTHERSENEEDNDFFKKLKIHSEAAVLISDQTSGYGIKMTVNYKVVNTLYGGVAVGLDNYIDNAELNVYSVGANIRHYFSNIPKHPFLNLTTGYGSFYPLQKYNQVSGQGGFFWNPSAGLSFGSKISFDVSVGLRFQNTSITYQNGETESELRWKYRRLAIQIGMSF